MPDQPLLGRLIPGSDSAEVSMSLLKGKYVKDVVKEGVNTLLFTLTENVTDTTLELRLPLAIFEGGTPGQVLKKQSSTDGDIGWGQDLHTVTDAAVQIADGSITTIKLADGAVTTIKLHDGAVVEDKIDDEAVSERKLTSEVADKLGTLTIRKQGSSDVQASVLQIDGVDVVISPDNQVATITIPSGLNTVITGTGLIGTGLQSDPVRIGPGRVTSSLLEPTLLEKINNAFGRTTADLATKDQLDNLEETIFTAVTRIASDSVSFGYNNAQYVPNSLTVPSSGFLKFSVNHIAEGQRDTANVDVDDLNNLSPIPDGHNLRSLESNERLVLSKFLEPDMDLWVGRTATNKIVVQSSGTYNVTRYLTVSEVKPRAALSNDNVKDIVGELLEAAVWTGGSATYDSTHHTLTVTVNTTEGGRTNISIGATAPTNPNTGALWSDTTSLQLKRYTGSEWIRVGSTPTAERVKISSTEPTSPTIGDLWVDTSNNLLKLYDSTSTWVNVGKTTPQINSLIKPFAQTGNTVKVSSSDLDPGQRLPTPDTGKILSWNVSGLLENIDNTRRQIAALATLSDLPAIDSYTANEVINVNGKLFILKSDDTNLVTGVIGKSGTIAGANNIPGTTTEGSFNNVTMMFEFPFTSGDDSLGFSTRLRVPRSWFAGSPPSSLTIEFHSGNQYVELGVDRNTSLDLPDYYGYSDTGDTEVGSDATYPLTGQAFSIALYTGDTKSNPLVIHHANRWEDFLHLALKDNILTKNQVSEYARDAVTVALNGGSGDIQYTGNDSADTINSVIKDGSVDPDKLDADTESKKQRIRDRIGAEGTLIAGNGVTLTAGTNGYRTLTIPGNPRIPGNNPTDEQRFKAPALDYRHDFRVEAIEINRLHSFTFTFDSSADQWRANNVPITPDINLLIDYRRVGGRPQDNPGKFTFWVSPLDTTKNLSNIFSGKTITEVLFHIGATESLADSATELAVPVTAVPIGTGNTFRFESTSPQASDPTPLGPGRTSAYVKINFKFSDDTRAYGSDYNERSINPGDLKKITREQHLKSANVSSDGRSLTIVAKAGTPLGTERNVTFSPAGVIATDRLPDPSTAGERLYVRADYTEPGAIIEAGDFAGTDLVGHNYGTYGYWRDGNVGTLIGDFPELILISENRVAVVHGSIETVTRLHAAGFSYDLTLTTNGSDVKLTGKDGEVHVDIYSYAPTLTKGTWNDIQIERRDGSKTPVNITIEKGEYIDTGTLWLPTGFNAPQGNPVHNFKVRVEEVIPGEAQTKAISFVNVQDSQDTAIQGYYIADNPFANVESIHFEGRSQQTNLNRYIISIRSQLAVGDDIPIVLRVGTTDYPLRPIVGTVNTSMFMTVTQVASNDRISTALRALNFDLKYANQLWANGHNQTTAIKSITKQDLHSAVSDVPNVTHLPRNPYDGQRVNLIHDDTLDGYAILVPGVAASGFVGYYNGRPVIGSLTPDAPALIEGLASYPRGTSGFVGTTQLLNPSTNAKTPYHVYINGRRYAVSSRANHYYLLNGADGTTLLENVSYSINVEFSDGTKAYPDRSFIPGDYSYNGYEWVPTPGATVQPIDLSIGQTELVYPRLIVIDGPNRFRLMKGPTKLFDDSITGVSILSTNGNRDNRPHIFSPNFNVATEVDGKFTSQIDLQIESPSDVSLGFIEPGNTSYRASDITSVSRLQRDSVYDSNNHQGISILEVQLVNSTSSGSTQLLGKVRVYLTKDSSNHLGYHVRYDGAGTAAKTLAVTGRMLLDYQPFIS